ncbi:hypothetical protein MKW94_026579 [Papaver nudicaule]|uniref:Peptidase A1 domain-containing protein n=1 Tax=Papaver nudicaule TaxID=74823 RepID=A0AA42ATX5_PAPNU|nr:hypothetical protein [Papaver nudicaule]
MVAHVIEGLGSGEYFSRVGVGIPPKPQYLILDTGSDITWLQCEPCNNKCYNQTDPIFDPSSSTSFSQTPCGTQECNLLPDSACSNRTCRYQVSGDDGSYSIGELSKSGSSTTTRENIYIGCGHDNRGLSNSAAGLLALGRGSLSFPSQVNAYVFSYCLVDRDLGWSSTLQFGSGAEPPDAITAPLLGHPQYPTFHYVGLTGISVGGRPLSLPQSVFDINPSSPSGVIVDTGTSATRLPTDPCLTFHLPLYDTCYDLSSETSISIPAIAFLLPDGKSWVLPASNCLVPVDNRNKFCLAFAPTNSSVSIIGNLQQKGFRVSFNIVDSVIGFSPNRC